MTPLVRHLGRCAALGPVWAGFAVLGITLHQRSKDNAARRGVLNSSPGMDPSPVPGDDHAPVRSSGGERTVDRPPAARAPERTAAGESVYPASDELSAGIPERWFTGPTPAPSLADRHFRYLMLRRHALSTAGKPFRERVRAQADYITGEAIELSDAVMAYALSSTSASERAVLHELADVVLAAVTLANYLGVSVEQCIELKTQADRGRG